MITQLRSYEAEAEILGAVRTVKVDESSITVFGIEGLGEAGRILDALAKGGIAGVVHAHGAPLPGGPRPNREPADVPEGNPTPGAAPVSTSGSPSPGSSPPMSAPPAQPSKPAESKETTGAIPENIKGAGKLSEVVVWIMDRGIKEYKGVLAELKRLSPNVPVVSRVSDLEARLKRTMEKLAAEDD